MKVVLTGGAGFIGSNLARYWLRVHPDDSLVILDALTYAGHRESLADLEGQPRFTFVRGNITRPEDVERTLKGADLVLHMAAETHNDKAIASPMQFVRTNIEGTAVLLEAARRLDIPRFHHVSTDEVFGTLDLGERRRFTLTTPYQPRGPYSASKAAADHLVRAWSETYGLGVTISNCGNNFGPYQHPEKLIPLTITQLLKGKPVPVYGTGRNVRDWIFVEDHCAAIDLISHQGSRGATYLVSAENEFSNNEIVAKLAALLDADPGLVRFVPDRPGHDLRYALDPSILRAELGWRPRYEFDAALALTVSWYRAHEPWWSRFTSPVSLPRTTGREQSGQRRRAQRREPKP